MCSVVQLEIEKVLFERVLDFVLRVWGELENFYLFIFWFVAFVFVFCR